MSDEEQRLQDGMEVPKTPPMGPALCAAVDDLKPVATRRPKREFILFVALSLPFFALMVAILGTRADLPSLSPLWIGGVSLVWIVSYAASAYLGFVPAKGHVAPRSRTCRQIVAALSLVVVALGLFATQTVEGASTTYPSTMANVVSHAGACSMMGFGSAILPGIIALLVMRRFVPVGRASIGLSLGAAGGSLSGLALLLHCPISERFHVGLVHGGAVVTAAIFVAGVSQILLRER
jgi:hypothetical protein